MKLAARILVLLIACGIYSIAPTASAAAQDFRGSLTGQVTDASGAAIPGAQVVVTDEATNTSATAVTDESGRYSALYLTPGTYRVTVETRGFKKLIRLGVAVKVGDRQELNLTQEVGDIDESVVVTTDPPALQSNVASAGQVIDQTAIEALPLPDRNPFTLTRLAPGVTFTGQLSFQRPFDQNQTSSVVSNGGSNGNEYTLDGAASITPVRRLVGFVPPADAVQEFKVETVSFDAQQGHTTGANVNVVLKSGTNDFHGTTYYFNRNDALAANNFFSNRTGQPRSALRYHLYGLTFGGPVTLPRTGSGGAPLWSGRDKTFFFFSYEGIKNTFPQVTLLTVPTLAQRGGDFSALLSQGITIYDPQTARASGSRVSRQPVRCDGRVNVICPERISPVARNVLQYYPLPNAEGDAQGRNNYITPNPRTDDYHSESIRVDHNLSDRQKFFVRYSHNRRLENRNIRFGVVGGVRPTGDFLERVNDNAVYDHVYTVTPSTVFNFRVGYSRFDENGGAVSNGEFNPSSLGFSPATAALFGDSAYFPQFSIGPYQSLGGDAPLFTAQHTYSFQPTLNHIRGGHSLRLGYDFRAYREPASSLSAPTSRAGRSTTHPELPSAKTSLRFCSASPPAV